MAERQSWQVDGAHYRDLVQRLACEVCEVSVQCILVMHDLICLNLDICGWTNRQRVSHRHGANSHRRVMCSPAA